MKTVTIYKADGSSMKFHAESFVWEDDALVFYVQQHAVAKCATNEIAGAYHKDSDGVERRIRSK